MSSYIYVVELKFPHYEMEYHTSLHLSKAGADIALERLLNYVDNYWIEYNNRYQRKSGVKSDELRKYSSKKLQKFVTLPKLHKSEEFSIWYEPPSDQGDNLIVVTRMKVNE